MDQFYHAHRARRGESVATVTAEPVQRREAGLAATPPTKSKGKPPRGWHSVKNRAVAPPLDSEIDQLYRLPLEEFTAARNALAKSAGPRAAEIKKLEKPTLAAWAANQLYWREPRTFHAVVKAANDMRAAYKQMLAGKAADVRGAEAVHDAALADAKQAARRILEQSGHANPEPVMMAVADTLDALPSQDPPGRLTKPLRRMGFNVLEGVPISAKAVPLKPKTAPPEAVPGKTVRRAADTEARERAMARERLRFAEAAEREAEAALDRARRAVKRAERTRARVEREFDDAATAEQAAIKERTAAEKALAKATAERARLAARVTS